MLVSVCLLDDLILGFCYSSLSLETGGFELITSTITLVLQVNRLTKCASHPGMYSSPFSIVSIVDFKHVFVSWVVEETRSSQEEITSYRYFAAMYLSHVRLLSKIFITFLANFPFQYPLKTSVNLMVISTNILVL